MASYKVLITRSASNEIEAVPIRDRRRIIEKIRGLSDDPRPMGAEKLSGDDKYRLRQGDFRILYEIQDRELIVIRVSGVSELYPDCAGQFSLLSEIASTTRISMLCASGARRKRPLAR